ncbi:hypothetical protein PHLGIDRAFT_34766 [Phlebiopsis gigantea 11061_1 CR5-6]|uniref:Uncharacterized protein n=1 Tax=Phlebiopsis gigantea (strain 11061_1 CR5-6) TaxID=745531 RepID=A0A0C3NUA0_PHLG1|nr:hypothetical protein PHLGIDRAFT_34766 [Phlebiopsis gigantea 11061_1 CR5-6]
MSATEISEDHPLSLELASLRATAAKYQHEAHAAAVKLQRHSLETSHALERTHALQSENARLRDEVEALRAHPDTTPHPAALQVPELTLALRKLSDKFTLTEEILLRRTTELTHARSDLANARSNVEAAQGLIAQAHTQLERGNARERALERKVRAAQEERRLADLVVQEYADLVRTLEGRKSKGSPSVTIHANASDSSITLAESLAEGKLGLQKLLGEHDSEVERLSSQVSRLENENELLKTKLDVEQKRSGADRESLAQVLVELDKHRADDGTATKMVSRYMKFSQSTIDSLQQAMDNLRTRHTATLATLNSQIEYLHKEISSEHRQAEKLRDTLDELSEDISREAYGRRREVGLRLAFLAREEGLAESLRRWLRRSKESLERLSPRANHDDTGLREAFKHMLRDAEGLLESLNGQPSLAANSPVSLARLVAAQDAVATMTQELHVESETRLRLQRRLAEMGELSAHLPTNTDDPFALTAPPPRHASLGRTAREHSMSSVPAPIEPLTITLDPTAATPSSTSDQSTQETALNHVPTNSVDLNSPIPSFTPISLPVPIGEHHILNIENAAPDAASSVDGEDSQLHVDLSLKEESPASRNTVPQENHSLLPRDDASSHAAMSGSRPTIPDIALTTSSLLTFSAAIPVTESNLDILSSSIDSLHSPPLKSTISPLDTITEALTINADDTAIPGPIESPQGDETVAGDRPEQPDSSSLLFSTSSDASPVSGKDALLARLFQVKHRYQHLQKSFSDCNVTVKDLKRELGSLPPSADMTSVIRTVVDRLDDFNEDARVELEIRVADEERIVVGYETLLSVPGSLDDDMDEGKLQDDIEAFIDGSNSVVARATQQFTRKLDDLEHDVAAVKRAIYELADAAPAAVTTPQGWSSWTAGILGGPRPVSPAPTFGSVMTTPRVRPPSFSFGHRPAPPADAEESASPFASLGLRIAMPAHVAAPARPFLSPVGSVARGPRPRVSSTSLFGLGLGARSSSFTFASPGSSRSPSSGLAKGARDAPEDSDSDIE